MRSWMRHVRAIVDAVSFFCDFLAIAIIAIFCDFFAIVAIVLLLFFAVPLAWGADRARV